VDFFNYLFIFHRHSDSPAGEEESSAVIVILNDSEESRNYSAVTVILNDSEESRTYSAQNINIRFEESSHEILHGVYAEFNSVLSLYSG